MARCCYDIVRAGKRAVALSAVRLYRAAAQGQWTRRRRRRAYEAITQSITRPARAREGFRDSRAAPERAGASR